MKRGSATFYVRKLQSGSTIIMDNASFHRKKKVENIAGSFGHKVIFLPPYPPELNPIEHCWSALKRRMQGVMKYIPSFDSALRYCIQVE